MAGVARAIAVLVLVPSCLAARVPRGMQLSEPHALPSDPELVELARVEPGEGERALLVVYPRSACSASASAVLVDERGRFLGAVAPGTATLLTTPVLGELTVFSSVEVTAPVGTWHGAARVAPPPAPGGIVLRSARYSARECGTGPYFGTHAASKGELERELASSELTWLVAKPPAGQAWLDANRARVAEVRTTPPSEPPGDMTRFLLR